MKVFRCWWCLDWLPKRGKDCRRKECIRRRRSGAWKGQRRREEEAA